MPMLSAFGVEGLEGEVGGDHVGDRDDVVEGVEGAVELDDGGDAAAAGFLLGWAGEWE